MTQEILEPTPEEPELPQPLNEPEPPPQSIRSQVLVGGAMVALGLLMIGAQLAWIWYWLHAGARHISVIRKLVGGGILLVSMGILYAMGGNRMLTVFGNMDRGLTQIKWNEWLILLSIGGVGITGFFLFDRYLHTLGLDAPN